MKIMEFKIEQDKLVFKTESNKPLLISFENKEGLFSYVLSPFSLKHLLTHYLLAESKKARSISVFTNSGKKDQW